MPVSRFQELEVARGAALILALAELTDKQRMVFMLRHWHGLSTAETAVRLGKSPGNVYVLEVYAVGRLRAALAKYEWLFADFRDAA